MSRVILLLVMIAAGYLAVEAVWLYDDARIPVWKTEKTYGYTE